MILVDTSVWIDFFAGTEAAHVKRLEKLILEETDLAICGVILTEILQGISDDMQHKKVSQYLEPLIMLRINHQTWYEAANIYRKLRRRGITIRKTNDCIIAAIALEYNCMLLHNDKDFTAIQTAYALRTS